MQVYLCTTEYSSKFLATFEAHSTPVYTIKWNTFIPNIFLTCAAEWLVKVWDINSPGPLFMFDLGSAAGPS